MVHALTQIYRVLRAGGVVADLRPDRFASPRQLDPQLPKIYWASQRRERLQGVLAMAPENLRKHRAATRAVKQVLRRGIFLFERTETFLFRYHFQNVGLFERLFRTVWKESILRRSVYRRLQMIQRHSRTGHIVVIAPMRLNVLRKR
jgi:hypothetical protein